MTTELKWDSHVITPVPGILFTALEGRARVFPTGIEVFEVISTLQSVDGDWDRLQQAMDWLTPEQLRAALTFYELNREFVDARLAREELGLDEHWAKYPESKPPHLP